MDPFRLQFDFAPQTLIPSPRIVRVRQSLLDAMGEAESELSVALTWPGAYNSSVMRIAKYTYPPLVLIFSLGLMYSQVCGVICSFSNCSASAPVRKAAKVEHTGHCHQHRPSSRQDQPSNDSHRCPCHDSAISILTPQTISTYVPHHAWHPAAAELVSSFDILSDLAGSKADRDDHFRAPPWRPQFTVLRI